MPWVHAGPTYAGAPVVVVGGFMLRCRWCAVDRLAYKSMRVLYLSTVPNMSVPAAIYCEGPDDAFVRLRRHGFRKKLLGLPISNPSKGVAMSLPALVVLMAKTSGLGLLIASMDGAWFVAIHFPHHLQT